MRLPHLRAGFYQVKNFDRADYLPALLGKYGRDIEARKNHEATMTTAAWNFILADYLRPEKPALSSCYLRLEIAAKTHHWIIPSERTIALKIEREIPKKQQVLLRDGQYAAMRLFPAQQRTVTDLKTMEWINGDGYQHNVFVRWHNDEILRPKTWIWQDIRTRKILGFRTDVSENSDVIRLALADVVENYGIPKGRAKITICRITYFITLQQQLLR